MIHNANIVNICAIVQARINSSRLYGKPLMPICNDVLLGQILNRLSFCNTLDTIIVATTNNECDNLIENWCRKRTISCFRGNENNVLKRYYDCAIQYKADVIVRITADDPFKDPIIIDKVVNLLVSNKLDFACNNFPPSFPEGLDVEVCTINALKRAYCCAQSDFEKEHVTQYFYHNPKIFKIQNYSNSSDCSKIRLTVDTEQDLQLAREVYSRLSPNGEMFYLNDILSLLDENPNLLAINKDVKRSVMYVK